MFDPDRYLSRLTQLLKNRFGSRLVYIGLQGSYLRGEATETSDIDVMAVVEDLSPADLAAYRECIESLENPEKSCGFLCSTADLAHWNPLEICHLLHSTRDHYGTLASLVPAYTQEDVRNFVKLSLNNLYHALCHRFIYAPREKSVRALPGACKSVFFIFQGLHWLRTGLFPQTRQEALDLLPPPDREMLRTAISVSCSEDYDFDSVFSQLFYWCQTTLAQL